MKWLMGVLVLVASQCAFAQGSRFAVRFFGTGVAQQDRIKIPLASAPAMNVGSNFTVEFWICANYADNAGTVASGQNGDGWITGNIIVDRDVYGEGDYGDFGVALGRQGGKSILAFGVHNGTWGETIIGTNHVGDGQWHHLAFQREETNGAMRIYVDGRLDAAGSGPTGNVGYRLGRSTSWTNTDPFLVLGAEKHDAGSGYPSFSGYLDELRIWSRVLSTGELAAVAGRVLPSLNQVGLAAYFRLEEGTGVKVGDSVSAYTGRLYSATAGNGEWVSWTNGHHAAPIEFHEPTLSIQQGAGTTVDLTWYASRNVRYELVSASLLATSTVWGAVQNATNIIMSDSNVSVSVESSAAPMRFFRVRGEPYR